MWEQDERDPKHTFNNVESVESVVRRTTALVHELNGRYQAKTIVLVAHGDVLQILQAGLTLGIEGSGSHRSLEHLDTANYRCLFL